ncbi:hypothetical protein F4V57_07220 [Acinetobacter qingfengensis]|uniref:Uncharacterized protein n=1 Tax=Acinetobacter qingfengensis TaxID=1262585 RepID=A0A1E7R397_9GAMM|nr:hypothetical protein [Acinetobacter qingfengensis]KAA8733833.1 hypothetical protein F4V57_07220 [Acinetobacter qingfengensis]OEY93747.1 hypothetical protein BJI46_04215 [Acinetobacter qingfengensis]
MSTSQHHEGIQFPPDQHTQQISTSAVGKTIIQAALQAAAAPEAVQLLQEKTWRKQYPKYFKALVKHSILSGKDCEKIAQQGLAMAEKSFVFYRNGQSQPLNIAMQHIDSHSFYTTIFKGQGDSQVAEWGIPYHGSLLQGQALIRQIDLWQQQGIIDPSSAQALKTVQQHPEWFDLSNRTIVLFGAGSEAGPLTWLSKWKANIIAIDLPNEAIWQKIQQTIRQGNATLIAPTCHNTNADQILGADLLTQTPEIANWLASFEQQLDLAGIAYLDGEKHVRVSMAMISIMKKISALKADSSLMFMLTPTDIYAVPEQVIKAVDLHKQKRHAVEKLLSSLAFKLSFSHFFQPNDEQLYDAGRQQRYGIADCMVVEQGPNYALAKRLQQWYALQARLQGQKVSINIAPSTTTKSVIKNPLLKAAFEGASLFGVEAFEPETTNAIMAALWIYDLNSPESLANPTKKLSHPLQLIMQNANHGGLWYVPYLARTALPFAALYGWTSAKFARIKK